jgi:SPP1 family predicted phage head-tail adaptor
MLSQRLRHVISLDEKQEEFSSSDEPVGFDWVPWLENEPAECLTGPGREFIAADAKQAETTLRVTIRWRPGVHEAMRLRWDGRVYDIQSIETDATARRELWLRCSGGVSNGG